MSRSCTWTRGGVSLKMAAILVTLLFLSCILTRSCCDAKDKEICIIPESGTEPSSCDIANTIDQFCRAGVKDNTVAIFMNGTHKLGLVCEISFVKNVALRAKGGSKVIIECSPQKDASFKFLNVSVLEVSGIEFVGCGAASSPASASYISALLFGNGSDITVTNINVSDSKYFGIFGQNVAGTFTLNKCQVTNASSNMIRYDSTLSEDAKFILANCVIANNRPLTDPLSGGINLVPGNFRVKMEITNSSFIRNTGLVGGNMLVYYTDFASVSISNCAFIGGRALADGGGLSAAFELKSVGSVNKFDFLNITSSTFVNNTAVSGGGVSIIWDNMVKYEGYAYVKISDTLFDGNLLKASSVFPTKPRGGLALLIYSNDYFSTHLPTLFNVSISRCMFINHSPQIGTLTRGNSVISATSIPYLGMNGVVIESNMCTGVMAINCALVFHGSSKISNNAAYSGGGFQLDGSKMTLKPYASINITSNFAQQYGGGLIIDNSYSCLVGNVCFLQVEDSDKDFLDTMAFYVGNNTALEGGDNIFGIISHCFDEQSAARFVWPEPPENSLQQLSSLTSSPQLVCIGTPQEGEFCATHFKISVYPGAKITLPIRVAGQSGGALAGTVLTIATRAVIINDLEKTQLVGFLGSNVTYTLYSAQTSTDEKPVLHLEPVDYTECFDSAISKPTSIEITFLDCPFGFSNTENGLGALECICNLDFTAIVNCSIESQVITKQLFSWVGMLEQDNVSYIAASTYCPLDYCRPSFQNIKSSPNGFSQDEQCQYNRTGVLCGSCREGWSLVLGSSECRKNCSSVWFLLVVPFALAGILLVVAIHFLNLTVTMGTVCGLIFYANILQDYTVDILSSHHHHIAGITPILQVFLSWLNLDLGISTCFYSGMDAFGKAMFQFVFPIYIWLISAAIIVLSSRFVTFTRLVGENAVKVLSTLILLSYSKMLRVSFSIFNTNSVNLESASSSSSNRWALDGNIPYFDTTRHLPLFLIALLCILLLVPFSFNLLFIKQVSTLPNYSGAFSWIDKLKPFYDTFTGPFKDKTRFWTGLLLFVRMFLLIVHSLDYKDNGIPYCIIVAVCLFLSALMVSFKGVYKKHSLNILEYFFILNISLLFLVNLYKEGCSGGTVCWVSVVSHLLVGSTFFAFLGIIVYHAFLKFSHFGWLKRLKFWRQNAEEDEESMGYEGLRGYDEPPKEMNEAN